MVENKKIEFLEQDHIYLVDGVITPSLTQIIKLINGSKYDFVNKDILEQARDFGILVHKDIETQKFETESGKKWKELTNELDLSVVYNELQLYLEIDNKVVCCGTCDNLMLQKSTNTYWLLDTKNTAKLCKKDHIIQLNAYRTMIKQRLGINVSYLGIVHLPPKELEKSKVVMFDIAENETLEKIKGVL